MTVVHVVRHGQVHNPTGILYGRLPGFGLSELGQRMAAGLGEHFAQVPLTHLRSSPLQRAQETMAPIAAKHPDLEVVLDERIIEAANHFEGTRPSMSAGFMLNPRNWWWFRNPLRPSWGEPYTSILPRMRAAILDAAVAAGDGQAAVVSHELPIWTLRRGTEGRPLFHHPGKRECALASVTSFVVVDGQIAGVSYAQPVGDLVPPKKKKWRPGQ
ncbi:MAG: histidine phosphatase family protein [Propionibacteriaceae bacterium]|nr:histidine phosphatase family protein [Micropruina sp.]